MNLNKRMDKTINVHGQPAHMFSMDGGASWHLSFHTPEEHATHTSMRAPNDPPPKVAPQEHGPTSYVVSRKNDEVVRLRSRSRNGMPIIKLARGGPSLSKEAKRVRARARYRAEWEQENMRPKLVYLAERRIRSLSFLEQLTLGKRVSIEILIDGAWYPR